jgi:ParB family chromosome partitioning protein
MAGVKNDLLANVAASMRDSAPVPGETPPGQAPSLVRQHEGRKRLESACVIKLDRIVADPNQPRTEFDPEALGRLAESLRTRGQLQPIRVRWDDAASRYVVVVGERRWRAARMAGLESLACVVIAGNPTPEELLEDQLIENCLREDLQPIEQARAYKALLERQGVSLRVLAERLNVGHASISRALALLDLPPAIQAEVEAGRIPPATGYQISKVADPEAQAEMAREAVRGRLTRDSAQERQAPRRQSRGGRPRNWTHATARVKVTLAPLADDVSDADFDEALRAALAARRKARLKSGAA